MERFSVRLVCARPNGATSLARWMAKLESHADIYPAVEGRDAVQVNPIESGYLEVDKADFRSKPRYSKTIIDKLHDNPSRDGAAT